MFYSMRTGSMENLDLWKSSSEFGANSARHLRSKDHLNMLLKSKNKNHLRRMTSKVGQKHTSSVPKIKAPKCTPYTLQRNVTHFQSQEALQPSCTNIAKVFVQRELAKQ